MKEYENEVFELPWMVSGGTTIRPKDIFPEVLSVSRDTYDLLGKKLISKILRFIVHRVNHHDALVEALDKAQACIGQFIDPKNHCSFEAANISVELLNVLAAAKGEADG